MKIRNGFVSNSSSSSFVVLLPENFDSKKFVSENKEKIDSWVKCDILENFDCDDNEDQFVIDKTTELINKFITDGYVYDDDYNGYGSKSLIENVLHDFIIASVDVSSDSGSGVLADRNKIEKILKN